MAWATTASWLTAGRLEWPLLWAAGALIAAAWIWLRRERRISEQRRALRSLYQLSEEVLLASSALEILRRLQLRLPKIAPASEVSLYLYNRLSSALEPVPLPGQPAPPPIPVYTASGAKQAGAAECFLKRTLIEDSEAGLFIPMSAGAETLGVLEIGLKESRRWFNADRQAAGRHLGNQIGLALQLLEQQNVREQLFRSEKLGAAGQLISGVAAELRSPLEAIHGRARQLLEQDPARAELRAICSEAARAAKLLEHLVSFSRRETGKPVALDLNSLLRRLIQFRGQEWKVRGVRCKLTLSPDPIHVLGFATQLEQGFLDLLVHAERSTGDGPDREISLSTSVLDRSAVVQIQHPEADKDGTDASPLARAIVISHGGQLRIILPGAGRSIYEVLLPLAKAEETPRGEGEPAFRRFTILLVEPEAAARVRTVRLLGERKHRVVPVSNAEEGADLLERLRFDIALCASRLPGANWMEFYEGARKRVDGFILVSEGYGEELAGLLERDEAHPLRKPIVEEELDRVLEAIGERIRGTAGDHEQDLQ